MASFNPFCSEEAISHSNYCTLQQKKYIPAEPISGPKKKATEKVASKLSAFVASLDPPREETGLSARKKSCNFGVYTNLGSTTATAGLCRDLVHFLEEHREGKTLNPTYMAVFATPSKLHEQAFETKANEQLSLLQKATEPFYCRPESLDPALLQDAQHLLMGDTLLKVVSIYRNTSQGQLRFDYPMLVFSIVAEAAPEAAQDTTAESDKAQAVINTMARRYTGKRAKA